MHLVVDGYNVMHALPLEHEWPGRRFQDRRQAFLAMLAAYRGSRPHRITVVFDGAKGGEAMGGSDTVAGIEVRYSPRGIEADDLIRDMVEQAQRPGDILLVTSDKGVGGWARSLGASVTGAHELIRRLVPREPRAESPGAAFERAVKGPVPAARPAARSHRSALSLW